MTRMESRVEGLEAEVTTVKERIEVIGSEMRDVNMRMERVEASMETIREYLREMRESVVSREGGNRETRSRETNVRVEADPSPSYSPPTKGNSATPQDQAEDIVEEAEEVSTGNRRE